MACWRIVARQWLGQDSKLCHNQRVCQLKKLLHFAIMPPRWVVTGQGCREFSLGVPGLSPSRILEDLDPGPVKAKPPKLIRRLERTIQLRSDKEAVAKLVDGLLYADPAGSGLVVVNKPYGLPALPAQDSPSSLRGCLPGLAAILGLGPLEVIKCCDRYCSGIVILSTKPEATRTQLQAVKRRAAAARQLISSYLSVVSGHASSFPDPADTFVMRLAECRHIENPVFSKVHKEPVIHRHLAAGHWTLQKKGEKVCHMAAEVLARSNRVAVSLLNLNPSTTKNHLICVWLADRGYPLLGDGMYSYRVKTVMGQKIVMGPQFTTTNRTQILPPAIRDLFGLEMGEEWRLPKFLHYWRLHLPGWDDKGKDLTIFAPPPPHFLQALEHLKIQLDFESLAKEHDKAEVFKPKDRKKKKPKVEIVENEVETEVTMGESEAFRSKSEADKRESESNCEEEAFSARKVLNLRPLYVKSKPVY